MNDWERKGKEGKGKEMKCAYCNNEVPEGTAICPHCGSPVSAPSVSAVTPPALKSRLAYQFAALVLGGLGIHDFYAGRIGSGVAHAVLCVIIMFIPNMTISIILIAANWLWVFGEIFFVHCDGKGNRMK